MRSLLWKYVRMNCTLITNQTKFVVFIIRPLFVKKTNLVHSFFNQSGTLFVPIS